jgi:hypothetical protein
LCTVDAEGCGTNYTFHQFRDDSELGDLSWRFNPSHSWIPTDDDLCHLKLRVVAVNNAKHIEHVMHCRCVELYLFDDLRNRDLSFKNGTDLL